MNRNILCLLLLLASLPILSAFGEEEKGLLVDWKEVYARAIDITDKVKVSPGSVLETKSYRIGKDKIPRVKNPHPVCKAEKGWNSFPGEAKYPVRSYTVWEFSDITYMFMMQKEENRPIWTSMPFGLLPSQKAPVTLYNRNIFHPFAVMPHIELNNELKNHKWLKNKIVWWYWYDSALVFSKAYGGFHPKPGYGLRPLKDIAFVKFRDGKPVERREYPELDGFEMLGHSYELQGNRKLTTHRFLMKRDGNHCRIAYIDFNGNKTSNMVEFPVYGVSWGSYSSFFSTFPRVLLYDRNFGPRKGGGPTGGDPDDPDYWYPEMVKPKTKHCDLYVGNLETGSLEYCYKDMFYGVLVDGSTLRVPHIAKAGELGYGIFRNGRFLAFLPYSAIYSYELLQLGDICPFPISFVLCSRCLMNINYGELLVDKTIFRAFVDLRAFGICGFRPFVCVMSKPISVEDKQVRDIYIIGSREDGYRRILYSIEIPEGLVKIAKPNEGYLFFNGARLYVVTGNECWSVKILEENQ